MPMIPLDKTFPARESKDDFELTFARPSRKPRPRQVLPPSMTRPKASKKSTAQKPTTKKGRRRRTISPLGATGRPSSSTPRGRKRTRPSISKPTPPSVSVDLTKLGLSAEVERKQAVSSALLKSAAFVQPSSISGSLQGLLSGIGIGTEIDAAMQQYQERKQTDAKAARANKQAAGATKRPATRSNYGYSTETIA